MISQRLISAEKAAKPTFNSHAIPAIRSPLPAFQFPPLLCAYRQAALS